MNSKYCLILKEDLIANDNILCHAHVAYEIESAVGLPLSHVTAERNVKVFLKDINKEYVIEQKYFIVNYYEAVIAHGVEDNDHLIVKARSLSIAKNVVGAFLGVKEADIMINPLLRDMALFEFGQVYRSKCEVVVGDAVVNVQDLLKHFNREMDEVLVMNKSIPCVEHALCKLL